MNIVVKICDRAPSNLPAFTHIPDGIPAETNEIRNLSCDLSYAIDGLPGNKIQEVRCLELGSWEVVDYQPCTSTLFTELSRSFILLLRNLELMLDIHVFDLT